MLSSIRHNKQVNTPLYLVQTLRYILYALCLRGRLLYLVMKARINFKYRHVSEKRCEIFPPSDFIAAIIDANVTAELYSLHFLTSRVGPVSNYRTRRTQNFLKFDRSLQTARIIVMRRYISLAVSFANQSAK
jgi:hypothetical protein